MIGRSPGRSREPHPPRPERKYLILGRDLLLCTGPRAPELLSGRSEPAMEPTSAPPKAKPKATEADLDQDHSKVQHGKGPLGSRENPEVYPDVPGHIIPILADEFDDFHQEAGKFL